MLPSLFKNEILVGSDHYHEVDDDWHNTADTGDTDNIDGACFPGDIGGFGDEADFSDYIGNATDVMEESFKYQ